MKVLVIGLIDTSLIYRELSKRINDYLIVETDNQIELMDEKTHFFSHIDQGEFKKNPLISYGLKNGLKPFTKPKKNTMSVNLTTNEKLLAIKDKFIVSKRVPSTLLQKAIENPEENSDSLKYICNMLQNNTEFLEGCKNYPLKIFLSKIKIFIVDFSFLNARIRKLTYKPKTLFFGVPGNTEASCLLNNKVSDTLLNKKKVLLTDKLITRFSSVAFYNIPNKYSLNWKLGKAEKPNIENHEIWFFNGLPISLLSYFKFLHNQISDFVRGFESDRLSDFARRHLFWFQDLVLMENIENDFPYSLGSFAKRIYYNSIIEFSKIFSVLINTEKKILIIPELGLIFYTTLTTSRIQNVDEWVGFKEKDHILSNIELISISICNSIFFVNPGIVYLSKFEVSAIFSGVIEAHERFKVIKSFESLKNRLNAASISTRFFNNIVGRVNDTKHRLESKVSEYNRLLSNLKNLPSLIRQEEYLLESLNVEYKNLTSNFLEEYLQLKQGIEAIEFVQEVIVDECMIKARTKLLYFRDSVQARKRIGNHYYSGIFDIFFNMETNSIQIFNRLFVVEGYCNDYCAHPHIFSLDGKGCWGPEITTILANASGKLSEYVELFYNLIAFLMQSNSADGAGKYFHRWPILGDKDDDDFVKSLIDKGLEPLLESEMWQKTGNIFRRPQ